MTKILCPTDFSAGSQRAVRSAARLAAANNAELVLVHAWHVPPPSYEGEYAFPPHIVAELLADSRRGLDAALRDAVEAGARDAKSQLVTGVPWEQIVEVAGTQGFDVIVMGTHGRTGLSRILLGSVAEKVIRHAPCSVLAIRPDGEPRPFVHVLCPIDFSEPSRDAVDAAASLVEPGGRITLLNVIEVPTPYARDISVAALVREIDKSSTTLLAERADALRAEVSVPVTTRSVVGRPGSQILSVLDDEPTVDLVVVGSHGRTGIARALLGSVAEKVVRHARCPVWVARKRSA